MDTRIQTYHDKMQKAYVMVYDIHDNIIAQLDVEEGVFYSALFPGDYTIEVKFEGQASGYKEKFHMNLNEDVSKEIYLKPVK